MKLIYAYALLFLVMLSCIPDENPVKPFDRGGVVESTVGIGPYYGEQIYFSLEKDSILKQNNIVDWDLGFACQSGRYEIILNFGKFMKAAVIQSGSFNDINKAMIEQIPEENWLLDNSEGKIDSTAIGQWWETNNGNIVSKQLIYIIDRGLNEKAKKQGFVKFQILEYDNDRYTVRYANLSDNEERTVIITKNENYNYVQLSFDDDGEVKSLEPQRDEWDILFSKYAQLLYTDGGDKMWYSVTGAYLNQNNTEAALLYSEDFQSIDFFAIDTLEFSNARNKIGHEWKYYDMAASSYYIRSEMIYIIKGVTGFYYKLHFIDFYDNNGNKGFPKFEYKKI
jgi:hypothetical protein